jgi:hypothetical protein
MSIKGNKRGRDPQNMDFTLSQASEKHSRAPKHTNAEIMHDTIKEGVTKTL